MSETALAKRRQYPAGDAGPEWGVRCPRCASALSKVHDSRKTLSGTIRRRRWCIRCGHRYTTQEVVGARLDRLIELERLDQNLRELGDRDYRIFQALIRELSKGGYGRE